MTVSWSDELSISPHLGIKLTSRSGPRRALAAALLPLLAATAAVADPGYYVLSPYDREGIVSAELRYWTVKAERGAERVWPELALGWGVNGRWTTTLLASWIGPSSGADQLSLVSWQNVVLLTQGQWPVDIALYGALSDLHGRRPGQALEFGPVLQTEFGPTQVNLNLVFDRQRRAGTWQPAQLKYQWQLRQHGRSAVQPGLQGFGELGRWDRWAPHAQQSHRAGPALFFTAPPGGPGAVQVDAALLVGRTYGRSGRMAAARVFWPF